MCVWIRSGVEEEARSCGEKTGERVRVCGVCVCEEWKAEEDSDDERACVCVCVCV